MWRWRLLREYSLLKISFCNLILQKPEGNNVYTAIQCFDLQLGNGRNFRHIHKFSRPVGISQVWVAFSLGHIKLLGQALSSVQFSSVAQSCPTLCDPMNRSTPGLPVLGNINLQRAEDCPVTTLLLLSLLLPPNFLIYQEFGLSEHAVPICFGEKKDNGCPNCFLMVVIRTFLKFSPTQILVGYLWRSLVLCFLILFLTGIGRQTEMVSLILQRWWWHCEDCVRDRAVFNKGNTQCARQHYIACVYMYLWGFPGGANGKEPACQCRRHRRCRFDPWVGKIPWKRAWHPTPVFLPGESHGQRSLAGYSP